MRKPPNQTRSKGAQLGQIALAYASVDQSTSIPAPIGGWNAQDSIAAMPQTDALQLDNIFPKPSQVELRLGCSSFATGFTQEVDTILTYVGPSTGKLFGADSTGIYDITSGGAIGAVASSATNGKWEFINFTTSGGSFLVCVNGVDDMKQFDGTSWKVINAASTPAITGIATNLMNNVTSYAHYLWFVVNNSMSLWYLPVNSIAGLAVEFPMGNLFKLGGYIVACNSWTLDTGYGALNFFVVITSEGEVAVYNGTDPNSATTWNLSGLYFIGPPIGKRCCARLGGDLVFITISGIYPLSKALLSTTISYDQAITYKIQNAFLAASQAYKTNFGWQVSVFTSLSMLLVNVPAVPGTTSYQYVMNTITKAWCRFTNWNANCFAIFGQKLYFGTGKTVALAFSGTSDFGNNIVGYARCSFNYLGSPGQMKQIQLFRPAITIDGQVTLNFAIDTDFQNLNNTSTMGATSINASLWDTGLWDTALWGSDATIQSDWLSTSSYPGYCFSLSLAFATNKSNISWQATDFIFKPGGMI